MSKDWFDNEDTKNVSSSVKYEENQHSFQVDMQKQYPIYKVVLEDRRDANLYDRLRHTEIRIGDTDANVSPSDTNPLCYTVTATPMSPTVECPCPQSMLGRYVLARMTIAKAWHVNEVRIFSDFYLSLIHI